MKGLIVRINRSCDSEYPIGILWNMGNKYAREMMLKIAIMEDVISEDGKV